MIVRRVSMVSLVLVCAWGAAGCHTTESAEKAVAFRPKDKFDGEIKDFMCVKSNCRHVHFEEKDKIWVTPNADGTYHFKSKRKNGEVSEAQLKYNNGVMHGTMELDHHGPKQPLWLILIPHENVKWQILTCDIDPGMDTSCEGDQHAGYGHADD